MFKRVLVLTLLQLSNKMHLQIENHKRFLGTVALRALVIVIASLVAVGVLYIVNNILNIRVNAYFLIFLLLVTQTFSIIAATSGLITDLYNSKENQILLALPVKTDEVFFSKLMVFYFNEFIKNLFLIIPLLIGFGVVNSLSIWYYFNIIPMVFFLPMLAVWLAALISIPFMFVKNFLATQNVISLIVLLLFLAGLFYSSTVVVGQIPDEIRIVQLYRQFTIGIGRFMVNVSQYGTIYTVIGNLLFGIRTIMNYFILISTLIILNIMVILISRPLYFKLASASTEHAVLKKHVKPNKREKSIFLTFLRKELTIAKRSLNTLINEYSVLLSLPFFMYVLNSVYMSLNRNSTGNILVLSFNVMIVLFIVTSSNTASATAITTEGGEFVLLKTAPNETSKIAWAKITINFVFSSLVIFLSFLLFQIALPIYDAKNIWLLYVLIVVLNSAHIFWSFQIDVMQPKLSEYASTGSLSGNQNITKSISVGFTMSMLFGFIATILFFVFSGHDPATYSLYLPLIGYVSYAWIILYVIAIPFLLIRYFFFRSFLQAYFMDIEL